MKKAYEEVISSVNTFKAQIKSSINILESVKDEPLKDYLKIIQQYLEKLLNAYETNLKIKSFVIENIAHSKSTEESYFLVASWSCDSSSNLIHKLLLQLKISPQSHRWSC